MRLARAFLATIGLAVIVLLASVAARAAPPPPGAASCSGCHASSAGVATTVPRLAGRDAGEIVAAMQAFRAGKRPATVMDRIAKGFSVEETGAIAAWLAAQKN
ncbi:MAG TPA: sulfide dehydrogenase [Stellaceae bacterium]|jgi:cytochrome c553|nr:sulfide dehydrogenase [Stellaceae bacterium]